MEEEEYEYDFDPEEGLEEMQEEDGDEFQPTEDDLIEYAKCLGMDPEEDKDYLYIALEGLRAPVPEPWEVCKNEEGDVFFHNPETEEVMVNHPLDDFYRGLFQEIKSRDIKAKKQAEKEKQMRKKAGKLQGLGPVKSQKTQISNKELELNKLEKEEEVLLPNKVGNKIMNISNISSNHSKKSQSFQAEENFNKDFLDLNSSSLNSKSIEKPGIESKTNKSSPLKNRKLKLSLGSSSNKDIDKWYQMNMEKLINEKEGYLDKFEKNLMDEQAEIHIKLEDQLLIDIQNMKEKKIKTIADMQSTEIDEGPLKNRLNKEFEENLLKKKKEIAKNFENKKNIFKEDSQKRNSEINENFKKKQVAIFNEKLKKIEEMKNNQKAIPEAKSTKNSEPLNLKKKNIEKEIKEINDKTLDRFRVEELKKIRTRKDKEIEKMEQILELKRQELSELNLENEGSLAELQKSRQEEIFKKKLEIEKKTILQKFQEDLSEFKEVQEQEINAKISKYRNRIQESEVLALQSQILEEKESIKKIYQRKLDLIKMAKSQSSSENRGSNFEKDDFDKLSREINEIYSFLALNKSKLSENKQINEETTINKRNVRELQLFVLTEKISLDNEKNRNERIRKSLMQQVRKFKEMEGKIVNIDLRIATVFEINENLEQTIEKFNLVLRRNHGKKNYLDKKLSILENISDGIDAKNEKAKEINENLSLYQNLKEEDNSFIEEEDSSNEKKNDMLYDWKNMYPRLLESVKKNKNNCLEENSRYKDNSKLNSSRFFSPVLKFSRNPFKFF